MGVVSLYGYPSREKVPRVTERLGSCGTLCELVTEYWRYMEESVYLVGKESPKGESTGCMVLLSSRGA